MFNKWVREKKNQFINVINKSTTIDVQKLTIFKTRRTQYGFYGSYLDFNTVADILRELYLTLDSIDIGYDLFVTIDDFTKQKNDISSFARYTFNNRKKLNNTLKLYHIQIKVGKYNVQFTKTLDNIIDLILILQNE